MGVSGRLALWALSIVLAALMVAGIASYRAHIGAEQALVPWGVMVVSYVFFALMSGGIADTTIIAAYITGGCKNSLVVRRNLYTALAVLVPGVILVFADLLHPTKAYWLYAGFNPESRIALNAVLYVVYAVLLAALLVALIRLGEEGARSPLAKGLAVAALIASLCLETNLGMAFGVNMAVPAWYGIYSGVLFVACAFALGGAWQALTNRVRLEGILQAEEWSREDRRVAAEVATTILVVGFVVLWGLVGLYSWGLTHDYAVDVVKGDYAPYFWLGYLVAGTLAPLALAILVLRGWNPRVLLPVAGILVIVGIAVLLFIPYNYGGQHHRLEANEIYSQLAARMGEQDAITLRHYLASMETLAFIGGFGLALLLDLIGPMVLPFKPGEKPSRLWLFK